MVNAWFLTALPNLFQSGELQALALGEIELERDNQHHATDQFRVRKLTPGEPAHAALSLLSNTTNASASTCTVEHNTTARPKLSSRKRSLECCQPTHCFANSAGLKHAKTLPSSRPSGRKPPLYHNAAIDQHVRAASMRLLDAINIQRRQALKRNANSSHCTTARGESLLLLAAVASATAPPAVTPHAMTVETQRAKELVCMRT